MNMHIYRFQDEEATRNFAKEIANCLQAPFVMTLSGGIGVGKTTFLRAMLRSLGVKASIKSPTFTLVESYPCTNFNVHHFDCYRIHDSDELEYIGFREYFQQESICCIEWPERVQNSLKKVDLKLYWTIEGSERVVKIESDTTQGKELFACLGLK
ncbi:MAG: tRNA (adenosine(37)-N6)-threonylcarbamoyltransferase complex ATPase subunit type 1 TsaE [Legionella sp.]|nr:tRNA (adenosine(37)-N6)-threonylcarbamoyltransferase complex ATPase subunit type 1 TsaE [Legionella sp.]